MTIKISEFPEATTLDLDDLVAVVQSGVTKKAVIQALADLLGDDLTTHEANPNAHHDQVTITDTDTINLELVGQSLAAHARRKTDGGIVADTDGIYLDQASEAETQAATNTFKNVSPAAINWMVEALRLILGKPADIARLNDWSPDALGWPAKNTDWDAWKEGDDAGSDDFLVDNYDTAGNQQWQDVTNSDPWDVSVADSVLTLVAREDSDSNTSHAAIETAFTAMSECPVRARFVGMSLEQPAAGTPTHNGVAGIILFDSTYTRGFGMFISMSKGIGSAGDEDLIYTITLKSYDSTTDWRDHLTSTGSAAWAHADWTSHKEFKLPATLPITLRIYPHGTLGRIYYAFFMGNSVYEVLSDFVAESISDDMSRLVLFQNCSTGSVYNRWSSRWDWVKVS